MSRACRIFRSGDSSVCSFRPACTVFYQHQPTTNWGTTCADYPDTVALPTRCSHAGPRAGSCTERCTALSEPRVTLSRSILTYTTTTTTLPGQPCNNWTHRSTAMPNKALMQVYWRTPITRQSIGAQDGMMMQLSGGGEEDARLCTP